MTAQIETLRRAFADAILPPDDLTIDEWADRYRVLPRVSSSEQGQWRTSRFPFLREIMRELSPGSTRQHVVVMKGAQLGFTEIVVNWMLYTVDHSPSPLLYVQKTIDAVEKFSKQRFGPSIDLCPRALAKISPEKSRDAGNTIRLKNFPGGILIFGGANSAASLRSLPIERLALDEEDSFEQDIEDEGAPSDIAIRRTANFPRRKIFRLSTPTLKETSRIEPAFEDGDMRRYHVPCPHCGQEQVIRWSSIRWDDDNPKTARMICEGCKAEIPERFKTQMLENGRWIPEKPGRDIASFHISSLCSPIGFYSWRDAVEFWIKAHKEMDKSMLKVFINTVLGETWTEGGRTIEGMGLTARREDYGPAVEVPRGGLVLTCGVDVQDNRIEAEVVAHGRGQESWSVEYAVFQGDTETSFVWEQLDQFLLKTWRHESGTAVNLAVTAIDSGHRARVVYNFCKSREFRRIFPIKGQYGWGKGLIGRPKKRNEDGVYLFHVYADELKSKIYSQLVIEHPGPGFCHFPNRSEYGTDYFRMLTAERLITKRIHGQRSLQWELPSGRRNEALDCRCYAIAALNILNPNFEALDAAGPLVARNGPAVKTVRRHSRVISRGAE